MTGNPANGSEPVDAPAHPDTTRRGRSAATRAGNAVRATARGIRGVARVAAKGGRYSVQQARRAARAEGAGDSGLSRLIELHAVNAAGDAAVAISLAGTLFFQVPSGEARGQVALFLGMTMLPFAIVAPLIGPFLDRFSHGRRWAIGSTTAIRAFLCWVMAGAVTTNSAWMFPAALGCLVASKAYAVCRAAAVPRLVAEDLTLVRANARTLMAGVIGAGLSAPFAAGAAYFGAEWALRYSFVVFVLATILAILLPARADSTVGEDVVGGDGWLGRRANGRGRRIVPMPPTVAFSLRANCGPRFLSGFLTMFLAFLLRETPVAGWDPAVTLGVVIGAAGAGNTIGIALGSLLRRINPTVTTVASALACLVVPAVTAVFYGPVMLGLLGFVAGVAQSLAKLSLDSLIQRDVTERVQTSAFARSDTTLQLAWVAGGFVGIAMPLDASIGLAVGTVAQIAWTVFILAGRGRPRRRGQVARPSTP